MPAARWRWVEAGHQGRKSRASVSLLRRRKLGAVGDRMHLLDRFRAEVAVRREQAPVVDFEFGVFLCVVP